MSSRRKEITRPQRFGQRFCVRLSHSILEDLQAHDQEYNEAREPLSPTAAFLNRKPLARDAA